MFCIQCGVANPEEARFCYKCGKPILSSLRQQIESSSKPNEAAPVLENNVSLTENTVTSELQKLIGAARNGDLTTLQIENLLERAGATEIEINAEGIKAIYDFLWVNGKQKCLVGDEIFQFIQCEALPMLEKSVSPLAIPPERTKSDGFITSALEMAQGYVKKRPGWLTSIIVVIAMLFGYMLVLGFGKMAGQSGKDAAKYFQSPRDEH